MAKFGKAMLAGAIAAAAMTTMLQSGGAQALQSEADVTAQIEEAYPVKVLRVTPGEIENRQVWMVTVMNEGGTSNAAFQVTTLAVDRESGELVPAFRHHESGYSLPPGANPLTGEKTDPSRARIGRDWR